MCECGRGCNDRVLIEADAYARVRQEATQFVVAPGHHAPEVDRLVEEHGSWLLLEAFGLAAESPAQALFGTDRERDTWTSALKGPL